MMVSLMIDSYLLLWLLVKIRFQLYWHNIEVYTVDLQQLEELNNQIHELEAMLKPLKAERKTLRTAMIRESKEQRPFNNISNGWYYKNAHGDIVTCVYVSYKDKAIYTKPMYRIDGSIYGKLATKKSIAERIEYYLENGFIDASEIYTIIY